MINNLKSNIQCVQVLFILMWIGTVANAAVFEVTSINDSGAGSLRQVITEANNNPGADVIAFDIQEADCDAAGVCHIEVLSDLPEITDAVEIDGTTQTRYGSAPDNVCATETAPSYMRVELKSSSTVNQFNVASEEASIIKGLSMGNEDSLGFQYAIKLSSGANHWIACNHFGIDATGTTGTGLTLGILIDSDNGLIGTNADGIDDVAERNVINAKAYGIYDNSNSGYVVAGNYFGFTADGLTGIRTAYCILSRQGTDDSNFGSNLDGINDETERNLFGGCGVGILLITLLPDASHLIAGNWMGLNINGQSLTDITTNIGIILDGLSTHTVIVSNWISGAETAIKIEEDASLGMGSINNCINNTAIGLDHTGTVLEVPFGDNWWGDASGPSGVGEGTGASVLESGTGTVIYDPWNTSFEHGCLANIPAPTIRLSKTTDDIEDVDQSGTVSEGDVIYYSFEIENTSDLELTAVTVIDPDATTLTGSPLANLAAGDSDLSSVTATHVLTQQEIDSGVFFNQASVTADANGVSNVVFDLSDDPNDETNSMAACPDASSPCDPTVVALAAEPEIILTKVGLVDDSIGGVSGLLDSGDVIHYTFAVTNVGNVTLTGVSVIDDLLTVGPLGTIDTLAPGITNSSVITGSYTITLDDITARQFSNQAVVSATPIGGVVNSVTDTSDDPNNPTESTTNCVTETSSCDETVTALVPDDMIFINGFESNDELAVLDFLKSLEIGPNLRESVVYHLTSDTVQFYDQDYVMWGEYSTTELELLKHWLSGILFSEDPEGDYDQDGVENILDLDPFNQ